MMERLMYCVISRMREIPMLAMSAGIAGNAQHLRVDRGE
jgi:hypothetical protein